MWESTVRYDCCQQKSMSAKKSGVTDTGYEVCHPGFVHSCYTGYELRVFCFHDLWDTCRCVMCLTSSDWKSRRTLSNDHAHLLIVSPGIPVTGEGALFLVTHNHRSVGWSCRSSDSQAIDKGKCSELTTTTVLGMSMNICIEAERPRQAQPKLLQQYQQTVLTAKSSRTTCAWHQGGRGMFITPTCCHCMCHYSSLWENVVLSSIRYQYNSGTRYCLK